MTDVMDTGCQCGCNVATDATTAHQPCGCGCSCCDDRPPQTEDEVAELRAQRDRIDRRLAELDQR